MFKLEQLRCFSKVVEHQSITGAAKALSLSNMAVSKQLAGLEEKLNQTLLIRSTRRLELTDYGRQFLQQAQQLLATHNELEEWVNSQEGDIHGDCSIVAHSASVYEQTVFPWLDEFMALYPNLNLSLDTCETAIDINTSLHDIYWGVGSYLGEMAPNLRRRLFWSSPYGIFASPDYLKAVGTPKTPEDLKQHLLIGYTHNQPSNILVHNDEQGQMTYTEMECPIQSTYGVLSIAKKGLGLVNYGADEPELKSLIDSGELVPVLENYWWQNAEVFLYYHQTKYHQPKVRAFIDFFYSKREFW